jgi:diguanylate cyclase (GGDEF)-like protein
MATARGTGGTRRANGAGAPGHSRPASERDRLQILYDVARRLAAAEDTDEILRLIVHEAAGVLGVDAAGLRLLEGDNLVVRAHTPSARTLMARTLKVGESLSGLAVASDQPVVVEDLVNDTRHDPAHRQAAIDLGYRGIVALPLRARGKRLGVLSLFTRRRQRLRQDALSTLLAFADHAAMAIEKDRLLHSAQIRAERLAALARLNQALTASLDVPDVLESVAHAAAELMRAQAAGFWTADEAAGTLTLGAFSSGHGGGDLPQKVVPFGAGIVGWVARHRRPLNVPEIAAFRSTVSSDWFAASTDWFASHGLSSALIAPVLFRDALMGVLALFGDEPFMLEADDQHFLDNFATQVGVAIRNARLYEELRVQRERLERRTAELDLLNRMGELLQASGTEEEAYDVFASFVGRFFPAENTIIAAINPSRNLLEVRSVSSAFAPHGEDVFGPDDCWALRRGRAHLVEATSPTTCKHLTGSPVHRAFCIPLMAQGEAIGLLSFVQDGPTGSGGRWDEDHQRLAVTVADHLGLAIANLKLRATLRNQSIRDPLTGLFNRRYMEETLERELARAERTGRPAAVVMLDLDHFKEFNDTFGHEAGDLLLREFGRLLRTGTRRSDLACRYGGEEFVLVFPDMTLDSARERMDRLRAATRDLVVPVRGQAAATVTFSAGIAIYPEHGKDQADLLGASDRALYRAKREGRDQTAIAGD